MKIRPMRGDDAQAVLAIYVEGIEDRLATFETVCPPWEEWDANHLKGCRLVAESDGTVLGWGALSPVSRRVWYRGVAEVSVYVRRDGRGRALAAALPRSWCRRGKELASGRSRARSSRRTRRVYACRSGVDYASSASGSASAGWTVGGTPPC
jgi:L-amino acid N-acyltransferase YncA